MNCSQYTRKILQTQSRVIGFQNGQDASQVTLKNQARAITVPIPIPVETTFSKIGGTVANTMQATQQTCSPTSQTCSSGYHGVSMGNNTANASANLIGAKQGCAVCSDAPSSEPYQVVIPCGVFVNPVAYNTDDSATVEPTIPTPGTRPAALRPCMKDTGQLYRDNSELIADQGRQLDLRRQFGLPSKLQGLRGPVVNR